MSEKRFSNLEIVKNLIMLDDNDKFIVFTEKTLCNLLNFLVDENEQLRECYKDCKKMLSEAIEENELLECKEGVYNVHNLKRNYEQLKEENEQLRKENVRFKRMLENLGYKVVMIDD